MPFGAFMIQLLNSITIYSLFPLHLYIRGSQNLKHPPYTVNLNAKFQKKGVVSQHNLFYIVLPNFTKQKLP